MITMVHYCRKAFIPLRMVDSLKKIFQDHYMFFFQQNILTFIMPNISGFQDLNKLYTQTICKIQIRVQMSFIYKCPCSTNAYCSNKSGFLCRSYSIYGTFKCTRIISEQIMLFG